MSTAHVTPVHSREGTFTRLRNLAFAALFSFVQLFRRVSRIRQSPGGWFLFRTFLGSAGVALVMLPLSLWNNWLTAPIGLGMFLASILLPPAARHLSSEEPARELAAVLVVNGGHYRPKDAAAIPVRLFVGGESISALDSQLRPVVTVPLAQITATNVLHRQKHWVLQVHCSGHAVEFFYLGMFAERRARHAHASVAAVIPAALPTPPKARAASA